jgi:histidyl-tRNA synthetase
MAQINIRDENLLKLMKIQKVIKAEDDINSSLDESLARVLDFYRKFVPYN